MDQEKILKATHEGDLIIGEKHLPSAVLEEGTRVLISKSVLKALGRPWKGSSRTNLPNFIPAKNLLPYVNNELMEDLKPVKFKPLKGPLKTGFKAELLPLICEVYLKARDANVLKPSQIPIAKRAEILIRSLSKVGIIALIDECTGYQENRDRLALQKILDKYINKELLAWTKKFPDEFYKELFRLKKWQWKGMKVNRPQYVGKLTNDLIYERLAPGVLDELRKKTPRDEKGRTKYRFHQWLTNDVGNPSLANHLSGVLALMRASATWRNFERLINRSYPKLNETLELPFDLDDEY